jgi:CubicO group peptidase (beta-lactamase class C family)
LAFEELDELIREQIDRDRLPGLAIALVRGDAMVWSRGYGCADLETKTPVTPETVFQVQSITKTIVATALMQHVERRAFDLDAPIDQYLTPLCIDNQWQSEAPVTLRGLLTHSAGLPVAFNPPGTPDNPSTLEESIAALGRTERRPGDVIAYANVGYLIAGWLLGRLAGKRYDDAIRDQVLDPLRMRTTALPDRLPEAPRAKGYYRSVIDGELHFGDDRWPTTPADPAGGLCSTVEDLSRFLTAHINHDDRLLRDESYESMHSLQFEVGAAGHGMGIGFRVATLDGSDLICHGGDGFGFTDFIGALPDERVAVALLISMGRAHEARATIGTAALRALTGRPLRPESETRAPSDLAGFAGRYQSSFWAIDADVSADAGWPTVTVTSSVTVPESLTSTLGSIEDGRFCASGGFFDGWELTFEHSADGTPAFSGGLYPWAFTRTGDSPPPSEPNIDEDLDLRGRWTGTISSPFGTLPTIVEIASPDKATVEALTAHGENLRSFRAEGGRVDGDFPAYIPSLGRFDIFLRLAACDGKLAGTAYARGGFGEVPMPVELTR